MNKKRLMSVLILSVILVIVLASIGDLDGIVEQVKNQDNYTPIGKTHDCDPGIAICSVAQLIEGESIKLSLGFDQQVKAQQPFQMRLRIKGIDKDKIRRVEADFQPSESESVPKVVERFQFQAGKNNLESRWTGTANLAQTDKDKIKWQARIRIQTLDEKYAATYLFVVYPK